MFERTLQHAFDEALKQYPVVTLTGPRQSGKTTLVKQSYPERGYYNFENPDVREMVQSDPRQFINNVDLNKGVIFDEIQRYPQLLSYIQTTVDENRIPGAFILAGSHQLPLTQSITQSLAGRTALLELLPLSIAELSNNGVDAMANDYLFKGFFPSIYQHDLDPMMHSRNYIKTYVERDIRQLINIRDLQTFQQFIRLCAGRVGSTINRESLSNDIGMAQNTIKNWLSVLEASYLTFQLHPYFENLGKRLIKAPKLYFCDVGLLSYLLQIQSPDQMQHDKMRGALFENMVVLEILKYHYNNGKDIAIYFYRDSHRHEVDVLVKTRDYLIPIEIKSTSTFNTSLLRNITYFQKLVGKRAPFGYLVYTGEQEFQIGQTHIMNFKNIAKMMQQIEAMG